MTLVEEVALAIRKEIATRHHGLPKGGWDGLMKKAAVAAIDAVERHSIDEEDKFVVCGPITAAVAAYEKEFRGINGQR